MKITITYCVPCKYEPQYKAIVQEITHSFPDEKFEFVVIDGDNATFKIEADDQVVFSKKQAKRWPLYGEIIERIALIFANRTTR